MSPVARRVARGSLTTATISLALLAPGALAADYSGTARNIIPSGQPGGLPITPRRRSRPRCTTA